MRYTIDELSRMRRWLISEYRAQKLPTNCQDPNTFDLFNVVSAIQLFYADGIHGFLNDHGCERLKNISNKE